MGERLRRIAAVVGALLAIQAAAVVIYLVVERSRATHDTSAFRVERLSTQSRAPDVVLEREDGTRTSIHDLGGGVRLVHFWATWCPPCVEELPGLLTTSSSLADRGLTLIAISMDDDWPTIRSFFAGDVPAEVYRAVRPDAHQRYDVVSLPDTYLVGSDNRVRLRYGGARRWDTGAARRHLEAQLR